MHTRAIPERYQNLKGRIIMKLNEFPNGVFPTMITPYTSDNRIDYKAVEKLVDWYANAGCTGVFAVCQSSEMFYLSLDERVSLAKASLNAAKKHGMCVVASGHISNSVEEQAKELTAIHNTGVDGVVLVSNRLDLHNDGDDMWISNAEKLLSLLPDDIRLGIYECPYPYKRLLTPKILEWCKKSGKFYFIKDTCCNPQMLNERLEILKGSQIKLYNANAQTLLMTLKNGAAGYSSVMSNFHADLYVWLCNNYSSPKAESLSDLLSVCAFTEVMHYPSTAKYALSQMGVKMNLFSRSCNEKGVNEYERNVINQLLRLSNKARGEIR